MKDRFLGALLGLATGDALGTTLEFRARGSFRPLADMVGGGPFELAPGEWTDDTSMALCLAESLVACAGFEPHDQLRRYIRWRDRGHLSSNGRCFDIGNTVSLALRFYERSGDPFSGPTDPETSGNGCLMRLAPVPMFYYADAAEAVRWSGESARTTHGSEESVAATRLFGLLLWRALSGWPKEGILAGVDGECGPLPARVGAIARGAYRGTPESAIRGSGYVVHALEAALWCFERTGSYREAVLAAANLGEDADTTAAICGQLAGAHYGVRAIPARWLERLAKRELIERLALALLAAAAPGR